MRANERSEPYHREVAKCAGKIAARPTREFYDVAVAKGVQDALEWGAGR